MVRHDVARTWLVIVLIGFLPGWASGQCVNGSCRIQATQQAATVAPRFVVPVYVGTDPTPGSGIYVGTIRGRGVTLTCRHMAQHGVRSVGSVPAGEMTTDKFGYDMAAIFTEPLSLPAAILARAKLRIGQAVRIISYPGGRICERAARVVRWFKPEPGQQFSGIDLDVGSSVGDSGGAVLDDRGQVVAMVWGTRLDGGSGTACVSHEAMTAFLCRIEAMLLERDNAAGVPPAPLPIPDPIHLPDTDNTLAIPSPGIVELRILVEANAAAIAILIEAAQQPGPQGEPGPEGPQGPVGDSAIVNLDELTAAVIERLPPMRFQAKTPDGEVVGDVISKRLGEVVYLKSARLEPGNSPSE